MSRYQYQSDSYGHHAPLTSQVPYLNQYVANPYEERWGFLPFVGGLALGALFTGWGGGRPCCGGYPAYPSFPPYSPGFSQPFVPFQQQQQQQLANYNIYQPQPYSQPMGYPTTIVENNKFYMS